MRWWKRWRDRRHEQRTFLRWQDEMGPLDPDWSVSDTIDRSDLEACGTCHGDGAVLVRVDWETGYQQIEECPRCYGSGLDPAQAPWWAVA